MFCTNCGEKVLENDKFCTNCGFKINKENQNVANNNILPLLVLVTLMNGLTRQLYFFNNCYYEDKNCNTIFPINLIRNPFNHQVLDGNNMFFIVGNNGPFFKK